jgi:predicted outer membrane protein
VLNFARSLSAALVVLIGSLLAAPLPAAAATPPGGPVTAADENFIVRVHLATLWEAPAAEQAEQRAQSAMLRSIGKQMAAAHIALDAPDRTIAAKLGIALPTEPNAEQQHWLAELTAAGTADYDRDFVNILRLAHGMVWDVVAGVRANTQNSLIRAYATKVMSVVLNHMEMLESTGLVNYAQLAAGLAASSSTPVPTASVSSSGHSMHGLDWILLGAALVASVGWGARSIRPPRPARAVSRH